MCMHVSISSRYTTYVCMWLSLSLSLSIKRVESQEFSTPIPAAQAASGRSLPSPAGIEAWLLCDWTSWVALGSIPLHDWAYMDTLDTAHVIICIHRWNLNGFLLLCFSYVSNYLPWIVYPSISLSRSGCQSAVPEGHSAGENRNASLKSLHSGVWESFSMQRSICSIVIWSKFKLKYLCVHESCKHRRKYIQTTHLHLHKHIRIHTHTVCLSI